MKCIAVAITATAIHQSLKEKNMDRLQTLVATMNQKDFSLVQKMNIRNDVIVANQTDFEEIRTETFPFGEQKMISTKTRGVGKNRNFALLASSAEYLLFADDDIIYNDDVAENVIAAFQENPEVDVFLFSMDFTRDGKLIEQRHLKKKRLYLWNSMRYGTEQLAIRREAMLKCNLHYSQLFGGGCMFGSGEDSLLLRDCFRNGLRVYSHNYVLGTCRQDVSSWFKGYNEKYFYDKGVLMRYLFPRMGFFMCLRFSRRLSKRAGQPYFVCLRWMLAGCRRGKKLISYEAFRSEKGMTV